MPFDVLYFYGHDDTKAELITRRRLLETLLPFELSGAIRFPEEAAPIAPLCIRLHASTPSKASSPRISRAYIDRDAKAIGSRSNAFGAKAS
jgi:hypothetical protein